MDTTIELACYLSKVTPLPAPIAPELFDRWSRDISVDTDQSTLVTVPDGKLVMHDDSLERFTGSGIAHPYRRLRGRLQFRHALTRDLPVEIELAPWSKTHTELGLRPAGRRGPGLHRLRRYHELGAEVLDVLSASLVWYGERVEDIDERVVIAA